MAKKYKSKVQYKSPMVFHKKTKEVIGDQAEAWKADADCGCGIDCCEGKLKLTNTTTSAPMSIYFAGNNMYFKNESTGISYMVTAGGQ